MAHVVRQYLLPSIFVLPFCSQTHWGVNKIGSKKTKALSVFFLVSGDHLIFAV
jgi:hypothetical protein